MWAKLRHRDIRTRRARVTREQRLHATTRSGKPPVSRSHDGTVILDAPELRWGTDLTGTRRTAKDGGMSGMLAIGHQTAGILGIHAATRATRSRWDRRYGVCSAGSAQTSRERGGGSATMGRSI